MYVFILLIFFYIYKLIQGPEYRTPFLRHQVKGRDPGTDKRLQTPLAVLM